MKSCEYIKGKLGLVAYSNKDVFNGYPTVILDGRRYMLDTEYEKMLKDSDKIKYRVITQCKKAEG